MSRTGDEVVRAFVPAPLPPLPPIKLAQEAERSHEGALLSLGRLDAMSSLLPDTALFLYTYIRKEAVVSSQIEGTQSSLSDLLLFEMNEAPGVPLDDVMEVSNYVAALTHGLNRLRQGFPISSRLLREIHGVLLARGRGSDKEPGEFRTSQNWIGGTRPANATFVPPPHALVPECMSQLERFLHGDDRQLVLIRAALAHVQFETIHPFLDGNGRVGRLLITLLLCEAAVLREPLLYLSLFFKQHRDEYYRLLTRVRELGDWEAWLAFFLRGVRSTAEGAVATAQRLTLLFKEDHDRLTTLGRRAGSVIRVHDALKMRPLLSVQDACARTALSFPAAGSALDTLVKLGIARELTGKRRNRVFAYDRYLSIMSEGTETTRRTLSSGASSETD
jgi:Fic family protein